MNLNHLDAFLDAMRRHDVQGLASHMADNIVIRSPIVLEPFEGKAQVQSVLGHLLGIADAFEVRDILHGETHIAVFLGIKVGATEIDGIDYLHLNDAGLIDSMTIMWQLLPAVAAVQARLAPALGLPSLKLVEADTAP